jgi:Bacterial Ig-like domain
VPDGNTARFAPDGCYGQDGTIPMNGRRDLVIDGRGSEFRALTAGDSHRANWVFSGGANLTVRDMAVRGSNPTGVYSPGFEWQHGFSVEGVQGITLEDVEAVETWGDGVYLGHSVHTPACGDDASSARNVLIADATLERIGRQGVAVVDAEDVTVRDSAIGPVALANVDLETDDDCELARHVTITRNQFGAHTWGVVDSVGFGADPQVGDVTVTDNTQTVAAPGCFAAVRILSPVVPDGQPRVYRSGYTFSGNRLLGTRNGFELRGIRDVDVSSNDVALPPTTGCGMRAGVLLVDSHDVAITSNTFAGANNVFRTADALSTGITATGNSRVDTSIGSGPEGTVDSSSASFGFGATGVAMSFQCSLDGAAFDACSSPETYDGLADGPHTFEVRALDGSGAPDPAPASRTWTVDTLAPSVTLDQPGPGSTTGDTTPDLSGTAGSHPGDSALVTVTIWPGSEAGGSPVQTKATGRDPVTGAFGLTADPLTEGTYTARADQSDAVGHSGQSDPVTFTVDETPPAAPAPERALPPVTALLEPVPDVTSPGLRLAGRRTQKAGRRIKVTVTATSEDLWASALGKLAVQGSARRYRLRGVRARLVARGQTATLALKLTANALSAARRALRSDRDVKAQLKLSARDAAGNVTTKRRTISLDR